MTRRGSYPKGVAKREEILATALELIARKGYGAATVRELADAVGLSQAGLLHHFGTKEELFTEILRLRDETDVRTYESGEAIDLPEMYLDLVRHNAEVPGLVQLYSRFSAEAAEESHPSHAYFKERFEAIREAFAEGIRRQQATGRIPADADPEKLAVIIAALTDGLQTYWMYDPDVDMADHIAHLWDLIRRD